MKKIILLLMFVASCGLRSFDQKKDAAVDIVNKYLSLHNIEHTTIKCPIIFENTDQIYCEAHNLNKDIFTFKCKIHAIADYADYDACVLVNYYKNEN